MIFSNQDLEEQQLVIKKEISLWRKMLEENRKAYADKQKAFDEAIKAIHHKKQED